MVEISISISLLGLILVGVMGSLSTGFMAQRQNSDILECQLLTQQVLEEIQSTPYANLLSFNGTHVDDTAGLHRAQITAAVEGVNLVRIQVVTTNLTQPLNKAEAITFISNRS